MPFVCSLTFVYLALCKRKRVIIYMAMKVSLCSFNKSIKMLCYFLFRCYRHCSYYFEGPGLLFLSSGYYISHILESKTAEEH